MQDLPTTLVLIIMSSALKFLLSIFLLEFLVSASTPPNLSNCSTITIEQLNANPSYCKDERMTADCLAATKGADGIKGLHHACLDLLSEKTLNNMPAKLFEQISKGEKENLPKTLKFIRAFLSKNDWKVNPADEILLFLVEDTAFLDRLLEDRSFPPFLSAHLFTKRTIPKLAKGHCGKLTKEIATFLEADSLKDLQPACLEHMQPEFFAGVDADLFSNINPKALNLITRKKADKLNTTSVTKMTPEQAENWGTEPKPPQVTATSGPEYDAQVEARRKFFNKHGCKSAQEWIGSTPAEAAKILKKRCFEIWNSATNPLSPTSLGALLMFGGALFAFLL